ncbi:MAG: hypothetical protein ROY99_03640 [Ignavibacterium sp.]|jgi:hypothetical protein|nr:hypothetical protein [Ignavibacterium sp.]
MKRTFTFLLAALTVFAFISCKDNSTSPNNTGGFGGGGNGGGGGSVTFTVNLAQDQQQQYFFEFKPSTPVVINTITANCPAAGVNNEQVTDNGTTVYDANNPAYVGPITVLAQGQKWDFSIVGKVGSSTGASYTSTTSITIQ